MDPAEEAALIFTVSGAVPVSGAAWMTAINGGSPPEEKAKGAECGLSVLSLKVAARVKLVVAAVRVTSQSMAIALGSWVWQTGVPS